MILAALAAVGVVSLTVQVSIPVTPAIRRSLSVELHVEAPLGGCQERAGVIMLLLWLTQAYQLWSKWRRGGLHDSFLQGARASQAVDGVEGLIGNTPLVRIRSLSEETGCEVRSC